MVQGFSDQGVPPTHIAQVSEHKNLKTIENYSSLFTKQKQSMSNMLANISNEKAVSLPNATTSNPLPLELRALPQPQQSTSITDQQLVALFSGAATQGGQFSATILTPWISRQKKRPQKTRCGKDSASCPAVLMKIKGELFYRKNHFIKTTVLSLRRFPFLKKRIDFAFL